MSKRRQQQKLRNLHRDIQIRRDDAGVPHIQATSFLDGLYGLGYVHARDRLTQILFSRAVASGLACERIGSSDELLETDRFFRRIGLHRNLKRDAANFAPQIAQQIESYCAGVNDGMLATGRTLPMWATGFRPNEWNVEAVLIIGKLLSFGGLAVSQMQNERLLIDLIHAGANETALRHIFAPRLDDADFDLLRGIHMSNQMSDSALDLLTDLPRLAGSNAWAVSPQRSATGGALLAGDPHLEINRLPAVWYEAVLEWNDNYVMGATLPGCPLFAVARTKELAWAVTYMKGDTIDYFIEDCRQHDDNRWQYRRGDDWHDFQVRNESIVRKGTDPFELTVLENEQGIIDGDPGESGEGLYLSMAWTGNYEDSSQAISTWLEIVASENASQAMDAARQCTQPTLCFVFADRDGHIGLQGCGTFPVRRRDGDGLIPLPAWDEANHWQGWHSKDVLPRVYDPPSEFVATAKRSKQPGRWPDFNHSVLTELPKTPHRRTARRIRPGHRSRHASATARYCELASARLA